MKRFRFVSLIMFAVAVALVGMMTSCEGVLGISDDDYFVAGTSRQNAAEIELDDGYSVSLRNTGDENWFRITTDNDGIWDRVEVDVNNVDGIMATLRVEDSDGVRVRSGHAPNVGARLVRTYNTRGGTYYIRVTDYHESRTGTYTLRVRNLDINKTPGEPNDTRETAYDLGTLPVASFDGTIVHMSYDYYGDGYGGDFDWYRFETRSAEDATMSFTGVENTLRIGTELYSESFDFLGREAYFDLGQSVNIGITDIPAAGTVYYLKVYGSRQSSTHTAPSYGDYTLAISQPE